MEIENSFESSVKISRISLMLSGIDTSRVKHNVILQFILDHCLFYFETLWLHTDILAEIFWIIEGIHLGKSVIELSVIAPCVVISIMSTVKISFLYLGKDVLISVLDKLSEIHPKFETYPTTPKDVDFDKMRKTMKDQKVVEDTRKLLQAVVRLLMISSICVFIAFPGLPAISMFLEFQNKGTTSLKLPFLVKYFFDPFVFTVWPLVYLHQILATLVVTFNLLGSETLYFSLCSYLSMHFELLCNRLEDIVLTRHDPTLHQRLVEEVKKHQELIQLTEDVEYLYSKSNLFHILASSVLICLSGFNIAFSSDVEAALAYVTFLLLSLSQTSLLCYFGDIIMYSSSKVVNAVYKSRWYDADHDCKKTLFLILLRAQKPCKLTAAKFADVNLSAFTTILSRSWSYFAVLQTMYK